MSFRTFPTKSKPDTVFHPPPFSPFYTIPVPPSDTPGDAMSGEAGPAPGLSTVAGVRPRPAATVSLRTWGWNEGLAVGCREIWIPRSEGRASEAHSQGANAVANIQTAGRNKRRGCGPVANDQGLIPRARVPVGMVHHPAGTSRATGQAEASPHVMPQPDPRPVERRTSVTTPVAALPERRMSAGIDAERGAGRSHIKYLDRLLLAPRPRQVFSHPEDEDPTGGDAWVF
jgi:hypothetical protein